MPSSLFSYPSADGTQIAAYRWDAIGWLDGIIAAHGREPAAPGMKEAGQ